MQAPWFISRTELMPSQASQLPHLTELQPSDRFTPFNNRPAHRPAPPYRHCRSCQ